MLRAQVLDHLVRGEDVAAYLLPPLGEHLVRVRDRVRVRVRVRVSVRISVRVGVRLRVSPLGEHLISADLGERLHLVRLGLGIG